MLSCISIPNESDSSDDPSDWDFIVATIRDHAESLGDDDLQLWADLVAGMAELQDETKRR